MDGAGASRTQEGALLLIRLIEDLASAWGAAGEADQFVKGRMWARDRWTRVAGIRRPIRGMGGDDRGERRMRRSPGRLSRGVRH